MIPCFLTVFNLLSWPRAMAAECERLGLEPIIFDNDSDYPPLLEWLDACPYPVIRAGHNSGCYGFWNLGLHEKQEGYYVVSDSDLDLSGVPDDAVSRLIEAFEANPDAVKAGLSLEIEDIPEGYPLRDKVFTWERPYWRTPGKGPACWKAGVGATFALYHPGRSLAREFYAGVRLDRPYTARHLPWYLDFAHPDEEQRYYFDRCQGPAYWGMLIKERLNAAAR